MATLVEMPKLSDTMTVGTLVKWLKKEGDVLQPGDLVAEVATDKATMEVENFDKGVLLKCYVGEGAQIPIGAPMYAVGQTGESAPDPSKPKTAVAPQNGQAAKQGQENPSTAAASGSAGGTGRLKASPLAKKLASAHGVALSELAGSGPGGRIVKADVMRAVEKQPATGNLSSDSGCGLPACGAPALPSGLESSWTNPSPTGPGYSAETSDAPTRVPLSGMRATIARRLLESKTQIPHFYLEIQVDAAPLLDLRALLNQSLSQLPAQQGGIKLSVNDFILKATAEALRRVPTVNRSWAGDHILQHSAVHVAFGVAVEDGLLTPVVRNAHQKGLRAISQEAHRLIEKSRNRSLSPAEMGGSTFTVTNLGMMGIERFFGIINPPNAGILSVGATVEVPVVNSQGQIVPGKRMSIGFSGDHRVVDGAVGAQFLSALKQILEAPSLMLI